MFEIIKILRKEKEPESRLSPSKIIIGNRVEFADMPHNNIAGSNMKVKAINSYIFGDEVFLAYVLGNHKEEINLIFTKNEHSISLSRVIDKHLFSALFSTYSPEKWFDLDIGQSLPVSNRVMGMQQSWVASDYQMTIRRKGIVMEGNYLRNKKLYMQNASKNFDYVLFVDEKNEHALEAEQYEDGTLIVYSTIYRPESDIVQITENNEKFIREKNVKLKLSYGQSDNDFVQIEPESDAEEVLKGDHVIAIKKIDTVNSLDQKPQKEGVLTPVSGEEEMIALDVKLAENVISEAQRNKISIGQLIRKVIDLPADVKDEMMISFSLSDTEKKELAKRYNLPESDYPKVKEEIVKELQYFFGKKS